MDLHNRTFQHDAAVNQSFGGRPASHHNQSVMIDKSKLDGSVMLNKKNSVKASR